MHSRTLQKIQSAALLLQEWRGLPPRFRKFESLHDEPILMAQKVLDAFREGQYLTSNEIADEVNLSPESVRQVLRSLEKGGFEFEVSEAKGYRPKGGRPKKTTTITGKS